MEENKLESGNSYGWLWKERMDDKTTRLQPSKSRKRSLTCAVTGCTNNEYNLEVWRDSLCEIHHLPRETVVVARNLTGEFFKKI